MDPSPNRHCPKCGIPIPPDAPLGLCPRCALAEAVTEPGSGPAPTPPGRHPEPSLERLRTAFPQFELIERIGAGGMGVVFKVRQPRLDRHVALKVLPESIAADPRFAERFHREARVLARLNHPNIVTVHDFGEADGLFYLLMEYVDGVNLRDAMRAGRFTPAEALRIIPPICDALQFAHEEGILHRDIKPENILLDGRGRVKIADFGIAKLLGTAVGDVTLTATSAAVGTPQYMAPEQIERPRDVDHRADIYSLGVVFYEMLTGELPIGRFAPPSSKVDLDARVDDIVLRSLAKERELRQQSAGEVGTQVESVRGTPVPPATGAAPGRASAPAGISPDPGPDSVPGHPRVPGSTVAALLTGASVAVGLAGGSAAALYGESLRRGPRLGALGPAEWGIAVLAFGVLAVGGIAGALMGLRGLAKVRPVGSEFAGIGRAVLGVMGWPVVLLHLACLVGVGYFLWRITPGWIAMLITLVVSLTTAELALRGVWRWLRGTIRGERAGRPPGWVHAISTAGLVAALVAVVPVKTVLIPNAIRSRLPERVLQDGPESLGADPAASTFDAARIGDGSDRGLVPSREPRVSGPNDPSGEMAGADAQAERTRLQLGNARERLKEVSRMAEAGRVDTLEVARARRDVEMLEARLHGDDVGSARAALDYARRVEEDTRKRVEVGTQPPSALRDARTEVGLKEIDLGEALRRAGLPPPTNSRPTETAPVPP